MQNIQSDQHRRELQQKYDLENLREQFDKAPYPRTPLEKTPKDDAKQLFVDNMVTPFYLRDRRVVDSSQMSVLDVGCGTGYTTLRLALANPNSHIVGVDISEESIRLAKARIAHHGLQDRVQFKVVAIEDLAQLGEKFDYISCLDVLYFFDNIGEVLTYIKAALKPTGIIRANFHSAYQRSAFHQAQMFFKMAGFFEREANEETIQAVENLILSLREKVGLRTRTLRGGSSLLKSIEGVFANYLLSGDHGFTLPEVFSTLDQVGLNFIEMMNWPQWDLISLFEDYSLLSEEWQTIINSFSYQEKLIAFELINPVHRLLDFWCDQADHQGNTISHHQWSDEMWNLAQIHLHPQLNTEKFWQAVEESLTTYKPLDMAAFLKHTNARNVIISCTLLATCIMPLQQGACAFSDLIDRWLQICPVDPTTLEPSTRSQAEAQVKAFIDQLADKLFILPDLKA